MLSFKILTAIAVLCIFVSSCETENDSETAETNSTETTISKEHTTQLWEAGVNPNGAKYHTVKHFEEESVEGILSGDIFIPLHQMSEQILASQDDNSKQYRTNNLVSQGKTINVIGYTGSGFALTSKMQTALQWAVNNYNSINTSLTFNLTFAASTNADMVVYNAGGSSAGGQAEFPSGGNPGKFIQIFAGMESFNTNVNEHVMTHEMGHALGFRHTDYALRRCDGINEGSGDVGAILIPGTPSGNQWGGANIDSNSIMISCFDSGEDGEFSNFDIVALETLY